MSKSLIVFTCSLSSTPSINTVLSRYVHVSDSSNVPPTADPEDSDEDESNDDEDNDGLTLIHDDEEEDKRETKGDRIGSTQINQEKNTQGNEQQPPKKKPKKAPPPASLQSSTFPSFTDYLFAKYSSGVPPASSSGSSSNSVVSYAGSCYLDDEFVDDVDLRETVETELVPEESNDSNLGNENGEFYVTTLQSSSPKKRGRKPKTTETEEDLTSLKSSYASLKTSMTSSRSSLLLLLNPPPPVSLSITLPPTLPSTFEYKLTHSIYGPLTIPLPPSSLPSTILKYEHTPLPENLSVAHKAKLYSYSCDYDCYVDKYVEYSSKILKKKIKKREVLAEKWKGIGGKEECVKIVKLWKERIKRKNKSEEKNGEKNGEKNEA
ncbi:hypothetical protein TrVE_jg9027 [Triparma verrucosa]|uniref:Uncharacterized protein n=1 Tax=Triparma verrucosa TaxID=1606542 RepID=A0A9W7C339_9STRA|nr:hypothetical protein TrVE_jg9027 [Triparma verrucosa]